MQRMKHPTFSRTVYLLQTNPRNSKWATGPKNGIGTAYYDSNSGPSHSNVWFTLSSGILTEVFYPNVATPNLLTFEFIVTDNETFVDFERTDMVHETKLLYEDGLIYQQVNTAKSGNYRLKKTYVTNPLAHALCIQLKFQILSSEASSYKVGFVIKPAVSGTPLNDVVQYVTEKGYGYLTAFDDEQAFAVTCLDGVSFTNVQCGFVENKGEVESAFAGGLHAGPGQVWIGSMLENDSGLKNDGLTCSLSIGFGNSVKAAMQSAKETVSQPYTEIAEKYLSGWQDYLKIFHPPGCADQTQYMASLMTMKAHEDKLNPGAVVASLSTPWAPDYAFGGKLDGYHVVWPRDLCQTATTFAIAGDTNTADKILAYLDGVLQLPDGSFPQNAWPDGTPNWQGCQLDQTAFPILLAWQLSATTRYVSLVKPAADYLVVNGPVSDQERWEENAGYSPSTIAAEIAALIVAAEMASEIGDFTSAKIYRQKADAWEEKLESWLVVKRGKLSVGPYYIRINASDNPDDGSYIHIKNGGGWRDKTEIVDAGFLELVRLGIRSADDPLILHSLSVVDEAIRYAANFGPVWKRYSHDGYGENNRGDIYDGTGIGRPWPLLTGERGEFEVAWLASGQSLSPGNWFGPVRLLQALAKAANDGRLIPEQIWDGKTLYEKGLLTDCGNNSATPLVWAHAEYVRLAECIHHHKVVEMPEVVYERYIKSRGKRHQNLIADIQNDTECELVVYPANPIFCKGDFELQRVTIEHSGAYVYFHVRLGHLDNPWLGPNGLSKQVIDIYLNSNTESASKEAEQNDVQIRFPDGFGYETRLRVTADWRCDTGIYANGGQCNRSMYVFVSHKNQTVHVVVQADSIRGIPGPGWSLAVTIAGEASSRIRPVESTASEWSFGRRHPNCDTHITDFLVPPGKEKAAYVYASTGGVLTIPMVEL